MKNTDEIFVRQKTHVRFQNKDMDFLFGWQLGVGQLYGMSAGEFFNVVNGMRDGDADEWRIRFQHHARFLLGRAAASAKTGRQVAAGQAYLAASVCFRSVLNYVDPTGNEFSSCVQQMESAFQEAMQLLRVPVRPIQVPFEGKFLPGYFLEHPGSGGSIPPTVVMVGGGDTFREDLFSFADIQPGNGDITRSWSTCPVRASIPEMASLFGLT